MQNNSQISPLVMTAKERIEEEHTKELLKD